MRNADSSGTLTPAGNEEETFDEVLSPIIEIGTEEGIALLMWLITGLSNSSVRVSAPTTFELRSYPQSEVADHY